MIVKTTHFPHCVVKTEEYFVKVDFTEILYAKVVKTCNFPQSFHCVFLLNGNQGLNFNLIECIAFNYSIIYASLWIRQVSVDAKNKDTG